MAAGRRINKELEEFATKREPWVKVKSLATNRLDIQVTGPEGTPYAGGYFVIDFEIPAEYPFKPPKIKFKTPIYHPMVKADGQICTHDIDTNWSPQLKIVDVLNILRQMMVEPGSGETPLEPAIAEQFRTNKPAFERKAAEFTRQHAATPKIL
ncbi:ubiquitin-conjugating enzyme E2 [Pelomyxa schiedti]|nr:ubiquitin-conjugating enzyme E2 [Pelomyxa schiedti]